MPLIMYRPVFERCRDDVEVVRFQDEKLDPACGGGFLKAQDFGHFGERRVELPMK